MGTTSRARATLQLRLAQTEPRAQFADVLSRDQGLADRHIEGEFLVDLPDATHERGVRLTAAELVLDEELGDGSHDELRGRGFKDHAAEEVEVVSLREDLNLRVPMGDERVAKTR